MNKLRALAVLLATILLGGCAGTRHEMHSQESEPAKPDLHSFSFYLPSGEAAKDVTVATNGPATVSMVVQTHRAAVKETGPEEAVAKFGEVYSFSPSFIAVHREEPIQLRFWNLQPDDNHDFMLAAPNMDVLMSILLPPVTETSYVFTFHQEGLFNFFCAMHQPGMVGQILVLPPISK